MITNITIKHKSTLIFSLLLICNFLIGQIDSSGGIFIQGGFYNSHEIPSIKGFQTINFGYIGKRTDIGALGIDFSYSQGSNNIVEEYFDFTINLFHPDSITLRGGNKTYQELEISMLLMTNNFSYKKITAGFIINFGCNLRSVLNNPDPYGAKINEKFKSSVVRLSPYMRYRLTKNIFLFSDINLFHFKYGITSLEIKLPNDEIIDSEIRTLEFFPGLHYFNLGFLFKIQAKK